jgi:hypothetical protein
MLSDSFTAPDEILFPPRSVATAILRPPGLANFILETTLASFLLKEGAR